MRFADFEAMVRRMTGEVPPEYLEGVAGLEVSRQALPHPTRAEIYTLGECVPLPAVDADPEHVQSRVVLYHGSFRALARLDPDFDWREEAWETLTHELRHHLEWRARTPALEALDRAAEMNYARQDAEPFDQGFYLDGEPAAEGVYRVEDDYFLEQVVRGGEAPEQVRFRWHGRQYEVPVTATLTLPAFLTVSGVSDPPPGELVLVLRRRPGLADLFRSGSPFLAEVEAKPVEEAS
jgi:hypothetical protein